MKKNLLLILAMAGLSVSAQQSIPNGNFETWNSTSYLVPAFYPANSNHEVRREGLPINCEKITDNPFHGTSAIRITTVSNSTDSMFGYFINADPDGDPNLWHGGVPCTEKPSGLKGYYKCDVKENDTASIFVAFSKAGTNIGFYGIQIYGVHSSYTPFELIFDPALTETPDSIIFGAVSSNVFSDYMASGSMLQLDSIALMGVTTQPTQLNGDFELWDNITIEKPTNWYTDDDSENENERVKRNLTPYKGSYAIELTTMLGHDQNENEKADPMTVSTGYYLKNCNQCNEQGGYPFTNTVDTLTFWYKYTSVVNSQAVVNLNIKKEGQVIGGSYNSLPSANTYQYYQVPMNSMTTPDSLTIRFQSSRWEDSLVSQVGAVLIIDEVQLKSQPLHTGLTVAQQNIKTAVYPNPTNSVLTIDANINISSIEIINMLGENVFTKSIQTQHTQIDVSNLPKGPYFYRIISDQHSVKAGKLMIN